MVRLSDETPESPSGLLTTTHAVTEQWECLKGNGPHVSNYVQVSFNGWLNMGKIEKGCLNIAVTVRVPQISHRMHVLFKDNYLIHLIKNKFES